MKKKSLMAKKEQSQSDESTGKSGAKGFGEGRGGGSA
jgi:hypothetical protein